MVLPILLAIAFIGLLFTFRNEISAFAQDLRKSPEEEAQQKIIDERGGLVNTSAFIFGEEGRVQINTAIDETIQTAQTNVAQFIKDAQTNIDLGIAGVNTTLAEAQKNLEQFAKDAQTNIVESSNSVFEDITNFFGSFGGQQDLKPIATVIETAPKIMTQDGKTFDLSFLTSVEELEENKIFSGSNVVTLKEPVSEDTRFSGSGSLR